MQPHDRARVRAIEHHILDTEGVFQVEGQYYANAFDADRKRRLVAERIVRAAARVGAHPATPARRLDTWLAPDERWAVASALAPQFQTVHHDTLAALRDHVLSGQVHAVLVSVALMDRLMVPTLAALARQFPTTPIVGLVARHEEQRVLTGTLLCGEAGVRTLVDTRTRDGWAALWSLLYPRAVRERPVASDLATLFADLGDMTPGLSQFFRVIFDPKLTRVAEIAPRLGVRASTLTSRV